MDQESILTNDSDGDSNAKKTTKDKKDSKDKEKSKQIAKAMVDELKVKVKAKKAGEMSQISAAPVIENSEIAENKLA